MWYWPGIIMNITGLALACTMESVPKMGLYILLLEQPAPHWKTFMLQPQHIPIHGLLATFLEFLAMVNWKVMLRTCISHLSNMVMNKTLWLVKF
jgi:hypothetical protein